MFFYLFYNSLAIFTFFEEALNFHEKWSPKMVPRVAQGSQKSRHGSPRDRKSAPGDARSGPGEPQESPGATQERPKATQEAPKKTYQRSPVELVPSGSRLGVIFEAPGVSSKRFSSQKRPPTRKATADQAHKLDKTG